MKLSTIIRAISGAYVHFYKDGIAIGHGGSSGFGVLIAAHQSHPWGFPVRGDRLSIGDSQIVWWGRDTLVHPTEAS